MLSGKDKSLIDYMASIPFDQRLYRQDIRGSIAHVNMLARQEIISHADAETIVKGLTAIMNEIEHGQFQFKLEMEDIHMNIEAGLFEKIG
ncbi:MAG: argininosuccinate lyase, partial [Chloroflexota bacterium]|nr:argininosuccinate lyase [Chloroflexota bacterium]